MVQLSSFSTVVRYSLVGRFVKRPIPISRNQNVFSRLVIGKENHS
jgi:hypothetical protein